MRTRLMIMTAGLAAALAVSPALADDDRKHRGHYGWQHDDDDRSHPRSHRDRDNRWKQERTSRSDAYQRGYRDGYRRGDHDDDRPGYGYGRPSYGWNDGGREWRGASWNGSGYRQPNYRPASFWRGGDGRYYCRRQDGTTGLLVGAVAGGTLGNIVAGRGDKVLGSVIGGTLGAVIGNEIAKGNARCR